MMVVKRDDVVILIHLVEVARTECIVAKVGSNDDDGRKKEEKKACETSIITHRNQPR